MSQQIALPGPLADGCGPYSRPACPARRRHRTGGEHPRPAQAYRFGRAAWGLQFHVQVTAGTVGKWAGVSAYNRAFEELFADRILPFDTAAARRGGALAAKARAAGRGFPVPDGYIAAIAAARNFAVASRDTSAFAAAGLPVVDPWTASA